MEGRVSAECRRSQRKAQTLERRRVSSGSRAPSALRALQVTLAP